MSLGRTADIWPFSSTRILIELMQLWIDVNKNAGQRITDFFAHKQRFCTSHSWVLQFLHFFAVVLLSSTTWNSHVWVYQSEDRKTRQYIFILVPSSPFISIEFLVDYWTRYTQWNNSSYHKREMVAGMEKDMLRWRSRNIYRNKKRVI